MARKLFFLLPAGLFAVLVIAFAVGLRHDPHLLPSALIDRPAPDFALPGLYESTNGLTRNDLHGRVTLVNFFASWCAPCREEHPELMALGRLPGSRSTASRIRINPKSHAAFWTASAIPSAISASTATAPPRSILGFMVCRRLMLWTAPATSGIAMSVR